jgi:hypothetical protein
MKWLLKQKYTVEEISKSVVSSDFTVFILLILIVIHLLFFGIREHWFYIVLMTIVGFVTHGLFSTVGLTLGFALIAVYIAMIVRDEYDDILSWNDNTLEGFKRRRKLRKVKVPKKIPKQVPVVGGRNIPVVGGMGINEAIKKAEAAKRLAEKKAREARERAEAAKRLAEKKAREARERAEAAKRLAEKKAREARERARRLAEQRYRLKVQKWTADKESSEKAVRTNVASTMNTANNELARREKERAERNALIQKQLQNDSIYAPDRITSTQNYLALQ